MGPVKSDRPKPLEDGRGANSCQALHRTAAKSAEFRRILVIRLSALGDFIMALPAMAAIRRHHPEAEITLLTTAPFVEMGQRSGWFNHVRVDPRPRWNDLVGWVRQRRWLRAGRFDRVYDLQSQDRTALYFRSFWPGPYPEWSGIVRGASHRDTDPNRGRMHSFDIHTAQLRIAGIDDIPMPDLSWFDQDVSGFGLPERYALLVPGSAPHRPAKRWPASCYGDLAVRLAAQGITPVILGSKGEAALAAEIQAVCPQALDLTGRTSLFEIAGLARRAVLVVGNDTGPMHIAAMVGCRCVSLFSAESNPARSAPRGPHVTVLHRPDLSALTVDEVAGAAGISS